jgi:hypothetical protein
MIRTYYLLKINLTQFNRKFSNFFLLLKNTHFRASGPILTPFIDVSCYNLYTLIFISTLALAFFSLLSLFKKVKKCFLC